MVSLAPTPERDARHDLAIGPRTKVPGVRREPLECTLLVPLPEWRVRHGDRLHLSAGVQFPGR